MQIRHALFAFVTWVFSALAATAQCTGDDLRGTLTPSEQGALAAALDDWPNATGNVWRATRDGRVIDIIGTMHIDDPRFDARLPALTALVAEAEVLLVEATLEQGDALRARMATDPSLMFRVEGPTLPELLPEAEWQRLIEAAGARGLPSVLAAKMQPWFLTTLLSLPACALGALEGGAEGLDMQLMRDAVARGIPLVGVESEDTLFTIFDQLPLELQLDMLRLTLADATGTEAMFHTMAEAYFEERHGEVWLLSQILSQRDGSVPDARLREMFDLSGRLLLTDRNRAWIEVIEAQTASRIALAVGAAHIGGSDGLVALLEARGYRVERRPF